MNLAFVKTKTSLAFTETLYVVFFVGLVCAFRAVTSICIGVMILAGIILHRQGIMSTFKRSLVTSFVISCIIFFFLQAFSLLYTTNLQESLNDARLKSGLIFTPLAVLFLFAIDGRKLKNFTPGIASCCFLPLFIFYMQQRMLISCTLPAAYFSITHW
jgi:hypothetical protein